jgi:hypothetical protein
MILSVAVLIRVALDVVRSVYLEILAVWILAWVMGAGVLVGGASKMISIQLIFAVGLCGLTTVALRAMGRLIVLMVEDEGSMIGQLTWLELQIRMQDEAEAVEAAARLMMAVRLGGG